MSDIVERLRDEDVEPTAIHGLLDDAADEIGRYAEALEQAGEIELRLKEEIKRLREVAWQPIKTAPKDGTWVILATPKGVQAGYWGNSYFGHDPKWLQYAHRSDYEPVLGEPTHWMPLPQPPANHDQP